MDLDELRATTGQLLDLHAVRDVQDAEAGVAVEAEAQQIVAVVAAQRGGDVDVVARQAAVE
jgi:hypothetical protein